VVRDWYDQEVIRFLAATALLFSTVAFAQQTGEPLRPEWCREMPRPEYKSLERILPDESWFEVYRIRPGVFALYEPRQFEEVISYLIVGEKRAILFDTGLGVGKISTVIGRLTSLPVTVINSHSHFDHVGGNAEFKDIWNLDLPYTHHNQLGQQNIYSRDELAPERLCGALPPGVTATSFKIQPWTSNHALRDGEQLDLGGRKLEVIFTPGHTPDAISLFDRANGLLFTGDTFYRGPIYLFVPETGIEAYIHSVDRLAALQPQVTLLLPGHNIPVAEPAYLTKLAAAIREVQAGHVKSKESGGYREYPFDGFSLLLSMK
jgi:glyoxylase-like metal-dependent hydrolase (beta-lactamase superfamily II)